MATETKAKKSIIARLPTVLFRETKSYLTPDCKILTNNGQNCGRNFFYEHGESKAKKNCSSYCLRNICSFDHGSKWLQDLLENHPTKMRVSGNWRKFYGSPFTTQTKDVTIKNIEIDFYTDKSGQRVSLIWEKENPRGIWRDPYDHSFTRLSGKDAAALVCKWMQTITAEDKLEMRVSIEGMKQAIGNPVGENAVEFPEFKEGNWFQPRRYFTIPTSSRWEGVYTSASFKEPGWIDYVTVYRGRGPERVPASARYEAKENEYDY